MAVKLDLAAQTVEEEILKKSKKEAEVETLELDDIVQEEEEILAKKVLEELAAVGVEKKDQDQNKEEAQSKDADADDANSDA